MATKKELGIGDYGAFGSVGGRFFDPCMKIILVNACVGIERIFNFAIAPEKETHIVVLTKDGIQEQVFLSWRKR